MTGERSRIEALAQALVTSGAESQGARAALAAVLESESGPFSDDRVRIDAGRVADGPQVAVAARARAHPGAVAAFVEWAPVTAVIDYLRVLERSAPEVVGALETSASAEVRRRVGLWRVAGALSDVLGPEPRTRLAEAARAMGTGPLL